MSRPATPRPGEASAAEPRVASRKQDGHDEQDVQDEHDEHDKQDGSLARSVASAAEPA